MYRGLEATGEAFKIGRSLDQHCQEAGAIRRKLKNPSRLTPEKVGRLVSRLGIVNTKITQLFNALQA